MTCVHLPHDNQSLSPVTQQDGGAVSRIESRACRSHMVGRMRGSQLFLISKLFFVPSI